MGPLRGLSRGMQVFLLVDVLLVLLLVVLLITLPRGGDAPGPAAATPTPTAVADAAAGDDDEPGSSESVAFDLPSGNIACEMSPEGVVCTIRSFTYAAPRVTGCESPTGHVVRLDAEGFRFVCEDDGVPQLPPDRAELAYGAQETQGGYTCASGKDGVTCTDAAGIGFRLARAQWTALP
ncbi:hypothetical protein J1G42_11740 [Cellulomonas sp. zg-ZUI222]|uniref:Ig-like domain-containing protein n=1 Tax=Cellulomonas wangleii TaxID=2816956 RepID=A0ABX8D819_9CELL|nr:MULTISPECIES: hypothetical protein [Cellulomonas]MBO0900834.1 hypothetical protein [Cellulomonas sp. zg-ZUI22]MBO0921498.1 hypothetical protein [Cellulomonas wangleii]MBO0924994.1 hypothetical protein [Cellulomonas wangleii]QVI63585.1 hypothetical protein KG103_06935 [Cellulomonas wangleii]